MPSISLTFNLIYREYVGDYLEPLSTEVKLKPICPDVPTSLLSMDHLVGVRMRDQLHIASEAGLKEAFQGTLIFTLRVQYFSVYKNFEEYS